MPRVFCGVFPFKSRIILTVAPHRHFSKRINSDDTKNGLLYALLNTISYIYFFRPFTLSILCAWAWRKVCVCVWVFLCVCMYGCGWVGVYEFVWAYAYTFVNDNVYMLKITRNTMILWYWCSCFGHCFLYTPHTASTYPTPTFTETFQFTCCISTKKIGLLTTKSAPNMNMEKNSTIPWYIVYNSRDDRSV